MEDNRRKQLLEQYEDIALSLLMDDYANDEGKRLLQKYENAQKDSGFEEIPPELDKKCRQLIEKVYAKQERILRLKRISSSLARIAVVALVMLGLSTVTVLSVDAFRIPVLNFLMDQSGRYSTLVFDAKTNIETDDTNRIVSQFEANIPDGYQVVQNDFDGSSGTIYCMDENTNVIFLEIKETEHGMNIDTEDVTFVELDFGNYTAVFQDKEGYCLMWLNDNENKVYSFFANGLDIDMFWKFAYTIVE